MTDIRSLTYSKDGIQIFYDFVDHDTTNKLVERLRKATDSCARFQSSAGIDLVTLGTSHHLPAIDPYFKSFLEYFKRVDGLLTDIFNGPYILNSFGGNLNGPINSNYASGIHRDQRFYSRGINVILNSFISLVDFKAENGATRILPAQYGLTAFPPDKDYFEMHAVSVEVPAGALCIFNSNLWHCAGSNNSKKDRPIITPMFSRPMVKPQFDYTTCLDTSDSNYIRQLMGFNSRIPSSFDEWYVQPNMRCYKKGQDNDL